MADLADNYCKVLTIGFKSIKVISQQNVEKNRVAVEYFRSRSKDVPISSKLTQLHQEKILEKATRGSDIKQEIQFEL